MAHHEEDKKIKLSKKMLAEVMKEIDICMMTTEAADGHLHSRPMSNNRQVEWDGDSYFFASTESSQAEELGHNPKVNLAYSRPDEMVFVSLAGRAELIHDNAQKKEHWFDELERWFPDGPESDKVVLIKVIGEDAQYWGKDGDGEITL